MKLFQAQLLACLTIAYAELLPTIAHFEDPDAKRMEFLKKVNEVKPFRAEFAPHLLHWQQPPTSMNQKGLGFLRLKAETQEQKAMASLKNGIQPTGQRPNIIYVLVDDLGWADVGWHREQGYQDLKTPYMDGLVKDGVELDRHYVYAVCSPSRSAIQSGRNPIHVNVLQLTPDFHNHNDPVGGYAGIPPKMTGMAEVLRRAGYETHMYGKWDAGMATYEQTPSGKGYDKSLAYFWHENDYWDMTGHAKCKEQPYRKMIDLWSHEGPATKKVNSPTCSQDNQNNCIYEDQIFADLVLEAVKTSNATKPLFIFWSPHIAHTPYQVPQVYLDRFSTLNNADRRFYHAMVAFVDEAIGNVTVLLKQKGMWDNTLIVVHADNGGAIQDTMANHGANNHPLKGGKSTNWEGGIRVSSFISGGFLPKKVRGTKQTGLIAGWDWYATFAGIAGLDPRDHRAAEAGLPPIDSFNMWPLLSGQTSESPRFEFVIGDAGQDDGYGKAETLVAGLIWDRYKLILGKLRQASWTGPLHPNNTCTSLQHCHSAAFVQYDLDKDIEECGNTAETGCMYDIMDDPGEHNNIAHTKKDLFAQMIDRMAKIQKTAYSPERGFPSPKACHKALNKHGGHWGPFIWTNHSWW